jgi:18S rRNA (adenine1779-N6/adenine1780-N6)-dimethyltransferase
LVWQGLARAAAVPAELISSSMAVDDPETLSDVDDHVDACMPQGVGKRKKGRCSDAFKSKVISVLEDNGFADARTAKMPQDEFLRLLSVFNQAGIHFA